MSLLDAVSYAGKRALVVGGASGIGRASAEVLMDAGAELVVFDHAPVDLPGATSVQMSLAERASIDAAVDGLTGPFDAVLSCAGVADGTPGIERINFVGHRHLLDRMLERDLLPRGSAVGMISSAAGMGWLANLELLTQVLEIRDFDAATQWFHDNGRADYFHTKQTVCAFVAHEALALLKRGIRINAICPGPTDTPLAQANAETWLGFATDYRTEAGTEPSTPREQALPLSFLCSPAAAAITGITLVSDAGYFSAGLAGSFPAATPVARFLTGQPQG